MSGARETFLFDLSARTKVHVRGADALRFLNGQLTNDLRKATQTEAIEACVLNAKGKIDAHVFVRAIDDGFLLDAEGEQGEALLARLDRYIIADDVTLEDVTKRWALFHVTGELDDARGVAAKRFDQPGYDILVSCAESEIVCGELNQRFVSITEEAAEIYRIEQGVPRWGRELTNEIIPAEANLETRAVDFGKGCYIGQEVISRMKMSGQTNKRLCGLIATDALSPATRLHNVADRKDVGWITSATFSSKLGAHISLGFVKRGFNSPGTALISGDGGEPNAEVVELPFLRRDKD